jgi:malate dehydrogenase
MRGEQHPEENDPMADKIVAVIGAGNVGATVASCIVHRDLADVVLCDVVPGLAEGKALDLLQALPLTESRCSVRGASTLGAIGGADIFVVTAGMRRRPGMSRSDLLKKNAEIVGGICKQIAGQSPDSIIIMVTNPLDVMTYVAFQVTGFDSGRVMGMAGALDSARFRAFIAQRTRVNPAEVEALVIGGHGDLMVPVVSRATVSGTPLRDAMSEQEIDELVERTRNAGGEIVSLLKDASAFYAPGESVATMVANIVRDEGEILSASVMLHGEYGISDIYLGVPVKLGSAGVKEIVETPLEPAEKDALRQSADHVRRNISELVQLDIF